MTRPIPRHRPTSAAAYLVAVLALLLSQSPAHAAPAVPAVPADDDLRKLVTARLLDWNAAVKKKDFTEFHTRCAAPMRNKYTPADLLKAFDDMVRKEADISGVANVTPEFDKKPTLDDDGVLSVEGHYPTTPMTVGYTLRCLNEEGEWKVLAIGVTMHTVPVPAEAELKKMAAATMADFAASVKAKDFRALCDNASPIFQQQLPPEKVAELFKVFVDKGVDLSAMKDAEPIFDTPPKVETGPVVVLNGHYALAGSQAVFMFKYLRGEKDSWKLVGINVATK